MPAGQPGQDVEAGRRAAFRVEREPAADERVAQGARPPRRLSEAGRREATGGWLGREV